MAKTALKYKIGQRVKILPSAIRVGVWREEVGKIGVIDTTNRHYGELCVKMLNPCNGRCRRWFVQSEMVTSVYKKGEQLLLWDDLDDSTE